MSPAGGSDAGPDAELRSPRLDLTMPADMEAVRGVVNRVVEVATADGCAPDSEFEIKTAVYEALANAVLHGCQSDASKTVRVRVACDARGGVLIVVRDPGAGFDVAAVPSPVEDANLFARGGRGIFLIRRLMDEVQYACGGAEIRIWKK